jgi:hypothetical protein
MDIARKATRNMIVTTGKNTDRRIVPKATTSSVRLTTMFDTGSGLRLIAARAVAFVP